jgi:hypothetical protein
VTNIPVQEQQEFKLPGQQEVSPSMRPHQHQQLIPLLPLKIPHQATEGAVQTIKIVQNAEGKTFVRGMAPGFQMFKTLNGEYHIFKIIGNLFIS